VIYVENATKDVREELVSDVTEWPVRKIHGLMSNTVYMMSVCAVTSVGRGDTVSLSAVTQPPSR